MNRSGKVAVCLGVFLLSAVVGWFTPQSDASSGNTTLHKARPVPVTGAASAGRTGDAKPAKPSADDHASTGTIGRDPAWVSVPKSLVDPNSPWGGVGAGLSITAGISRGPSFPKARQTEKSEQQELELELESLQILLMQARAALAPLAPQAVVVEEKDGSVKFRIDRFDAGEIKTKFLADVSRLLGEERAAILLASSRTVLDPWLFNFGQEPTEFTITSIKDTGPAVALPGGISLFGEATLRFWSEAYPGLAESIALAGEKIESMRQGSRE